MMKHILCNWKMYFSYNHAIKWIDDHGQQLKELADSSKHTIAIFPSIDACAQVRERLNNKSISIGAQDCAPYASGAYTGQTQACSLQEMGLQYCIVGHSETRHAYHLNNETIAHKIEQLNKTKVIPVICIGESQHDHEHDKTIEVITRQLEPLIPFLLPEKNYYVAYEPLWAIGTGTTPSPKYIDTISSHIKQYVRTHCSSRVSVMYGGSVSSATITQLSESVEVEGFLIGKASTDFQELKKIVTLL